MEDIDRKIARTIAELDRIAKRYGLSSWRELEEFMKTVSIDKPETDLDWVEYIYLRDKLEALQNKRQRILEQLRETRV